jgi:soluble cytochrome b562
MDTLATIPQLASLTPNNPQTLTHPMKTALALLLLTATFLFADDDQPTVVAVQMKQIAENYKSLKSQADDPAQKDTSLALVAGMRQAVATARTGTPEPAEKLTGSSLDNYMNEFRKGLDELDADLQKVDTAIREGQTASIASILDDMNALKKTYHSDLR